MSFSGRHRTLLDIYGAESGGRKSNRKPERPSSARSATARPARRKEYVRQVSESKQVSEPKQVASPVEDQRKAVPDPLRCSPDEPASQCSKAVEETTSPRTNERLHVPLQVDEAVHVDDKIASDSGTDAREKAARSPGRSKPASAQKPFVLSLYGDGFLEVQLKPESQPLQSPRAGLEGGSFVIELLVFKAADITKTSAIVESDENRHQNPEIDDSGEFMRWTCCGSTNPSVYGCSIAAKDGKTATNSSGTPTDAPAPKLLVAKQPSQEQSREVGILLYDRGITDKRDSGCRLWWHHRECWAHSYVIPSNRWIRVTVAFDTRFLHLYFDGELVDSADVRSTERLNALSAFFSQSSRARIKRADSDWVVSLSSASSIYIGGHPSYSRHVREWRTKNGFIGLIGAFSLRVGNTPAITGCKPAFANTSQGNIRLTDGSPFPTVPSLEQFVSRTTVLVALHIAGIGKVRDASRFHHPIHCRRAVFWRQEFPPFRSESLPGVLLLGNFFHGGHNDMAVPHPKSFENLLLSVVQAGDFRVVIEFALDFDLKISNEYGCRTRSEYEQKSLAVVRGIEQMSPLLTVLVNQEDSGTFVEPPIGSFEIRVELTRAIGRDPVSIEIHSMASTGCFPNEVEVKKRIEAIVLFEAKRPQGEEIVTQAIRHFLALAERSRHNRERIFLESVINRKAVITERKITGLFHKLGLFFAASEAQEMVKYFRTVQENYSRNQSRIEDLPSLSMLPPTADGTYTLPFMNFFSISCTLTIEGSTKQSPWQFIALLLDYDFQLVDFVREDCPIAQRGLVMYRQSRYLYGGFVDRLQLDLTAMQSRVYCVLISQMKTTGIGGDIANNGSSVPSTSKCGQTIRVQFDNSETRHVLGMFDVIPTTACRWLTLGALYRSKKVNLWQFQALGNSGLANSLSSSVEEINTLLAHYQIIQAYEIRVYYLTSSGLQEFSEFAARFAKCVRFGRSGCIVTLPLTNDSESTGDRQERPLLRIALKLQHIDAEIDVYIHENRHRALPTIQIIYRMLLDVLATHGIKESLQHNPFIAKDRRIKRCVEIHVVSDRTNKPVADAHVFIERNLEYGSLSTSLANKIVPTLTMGSRLVSIRRRLQNNRFMMDVQSVAKKLVEEAIQKGSRVALLTLRRDSTLLSFIRSRTLLRMAMRRRYDQIRNNILDAVQLSEHTRIYSRNAPMRLQQILTAPLDWSNSERDLMQWFSRDGLQVLDDVPTTDQADSDPPKLSSVLAELQAQQHQEEPKGSQKEDVNDTVVTPNQPESTANSHNLKELAQLSTARGVTDPTSALQLQKKQFVTDEHGVVKCNLVPGTYTLYIFHVDHFEWTSVIIIYPTSNTTGSYAGSTAAASGVQEILIPLEEFRWSYNIQLVDFYQQQVAKKVAGIPLEITDKCGSQHSTATTDATGCAAWDVRKGLYTVSASQDCPCILYSAFKNIMVEGSRFRASRTICVPVLFGKIKVTLAIVNVHDQDADLTSVELLKLSGASGLLQPSDEKEGEPTEVMALEFDPNSSRQLQLRLGAYRLSAESPGCFAATTQMVVEWGTAQTQPRQLVVMTRAFHEPKRFRVVFSCLVVDNFNFGISVEVWKDQVPLGYAWRQGAPVELQDHVALERTGRFEDWEYQSISLSCRDGFSYQCVVAPNLYRFYPWHLCRPRIEIYSAAGCIYEHTFVPCAQPPNQFSWPVCSWTTKGEIVLPPPPTPVEIAPQ